MISGRAWLAAVVLAVGATAGQAQPTRALTPVAAPSQPAPPEAPFLRIDAGFHTAVVNGFAQDRNGRIIVTVSDDKTARIWQASDGALLATLRVPIAAGDEGALYAAALSPDGKTLLLAGNTGATWDDGLYCAYLFDTETGKLRGRLPNLPGPVNDIAYAPDGRRFALGMGKGSGVWLLDAKDGSPIGSDGAFRQPVTSVVFDASGRLYATGLDGEVRAYDGSGRRVAQRAPVRDGHAYRLAVSPDGKSLAVGYFDQPLVMVLNAPDLSVRARLDTDPAGQRLTGGAGLGAVTWLTDGSLVAAGSLRGADGQTVLRRWGPGAVGRPADISGTGDTVFELGATPDGGLILVGAGPALARIARTGETVFSKTAPGLDFRDLPEGRFRLSADGLSLRLQTRGMQGDYVLDMGQRRVGPASMTATRALTPVAAPAGPPLEIANWRNGTSPLVAGHKVALDREERARSAAAAPNGAFAVLGTDYALRVYRGDGTLVGQAAVPSAAWAVAVSGDSRVVVAGIGDGTLRWFGVSDTGQLTPRTSMFLAADLRRWVAWTDAGFFDYSDAGGDTLVGLQLNRARNQLPEWFSFAQVFRRYFSPDLVAAEFRGRAPAVPTGGMTEVRQTITQSPPPGVELAGVCWTAAGASRQCQPVAPTRVTRSLVPVAAPEPDAADATVPDGVASVTLQFRLVAPQPAATATATATATASAVDVFVNGRNAGRVLQQVGAPDRVFEQPAAIEAGVNTLQLRAYDGQQQTYAQSRTLRVLRAKAAEAAVRKPNLFLLSVGINQYSAKINRLTYAVPDAKSVAAAIRANRPDRYGTIEEIDLYDEAASSTAVLKAMADIATRVTADDTVLLYLSGHGAMLADERYYFITQDVPSPAVADISAHAVSEKQLVDALNAIKSSNTMLFLDTCHAGAFSLDSASKLAHETGRYILAAASKPEEALDSFDDRNGVFATAVLRGLAGKAGSGRKLVDNFELGFYVQPQVEILAKEADPTHTQRARFKVDTDNAVPFPIVALQAP